MALWPANLVPDLNPPPERVADTTTAVQMGVLTAFEVLGLVFVGLRVYARAAVSKSFGRDDIALCIAAICATASYVLFALQARNGLGRHIDLISLEEGHIFRICGFLLQMIGSNWGLCALKTAIAWNLLRFTNHQIWRVYRRVIWGLLAIVWIYTFVYWILHLTHCTPLKKYWDLSIKDGKCRPIGLFVKIAMGNTILATSTDVFFALVPIPVVWHIRLSIRVRLYLIGVLSLGYFSVGLGVVKTIWQQQFSAHKDKTYHLNVPFWTFLQLQVGIMATCCVAFRPLVHRILGLSTISTAEDTYGLPTISGGSAKTRRRTKRRKEHPLDVTVDEFELGAQDAHRVYGAAVSTIDERGVLESRSGASENGGFYSAEPDGTRSEEAIIKWDISRTGPSGR